MSQEADNTPRKMWGLSEEPRSDLQGRSRQGDVVWGELRVHGCDGEMM